MVDGEGSLPILGMVLEPVLLSQDCICIVVQTVLIVHKAGQAGEVNTHGLLTFEDLFASLMYSSMSETPAKGSTAPDSTPEAICVASLDQ